MNRINYILLTISVTLLLYSLHKVVITRYVPDILESGILVPSIFSLITLVLYLIISTFLSYFRVSFLGRSKYYLLFPIILFLISVSYIVLEPFRTFRLSFHIINFSYLFIFTAALFCNIFFTVLKNNNSTIDQSAVSKKIIGLVIAVVYLSVGFFLLSYPLKKSQCDDRSTSHLAPFSMPLCYKVTYLNIFLFRNTEAIEYLGGI